MKTSKKVLIGLGIGAVVGTSIAIIASEKIKESVIGTKNRYQVKQFVDDKLNGNEEILDVVSEMSDSEVAKIVSLIDKVERGKNKIKVTGKSVREATDEVVETLSSFVTSMMEHN